jgi:cyclic 2,3-diphosphoglycerate synthetase
LQDDVAQADADVFVVELKAAAVDVVAEEARRRGVRIVIATNDVVPLPGEPSLDAELDRLASECMSLASEAVG